LIDGIEECSIGTAIERAHDRHFIKYNLSGFGPNGLKTYSLVF
jgi:hypothetical protein